MTDPSEGPRRTADLFFVSTLSHGYILEKATWKSGGVFRYSNSGNAGLSTVIPSRAGGGHT